MNLKQSDIKRFYDHIITPDYKIKIDECWETNYCCAINWYSRMTVNKSSVEVHRISYIIHKGDIPIGLLVRHICNNKQCVNPKHLLLGTPKDNTNDRDNANRQAKGSHNWNSLLTEDIVITILIDIWNGKYESAAEIGRKYEVYDTTILDILNGKRWKHITNQLQVPLLDVKMKLRNMSI